MRSADLAGFATRALGRQRFRSAMMLLSVAIGVAAVVILVALGEGARGYVLGEFAFLGGDTVVMFPGRKTTTGALPPISGATARDITLEDVALLQRHVPEIELAAPAVIGTVPVTHGSRSRDAMVIGTNAAFFTVRRLVIAQGSALPELDSRIGAPVAVIGSTLRRELFDNRRAIGQWVRLQGYRYRVVGVLEGRGDSFGANLSEAIFVPVASAQAMFDTQGLFRVVFRLRPGVDREAAKESILARMRDFHEGEQDVTLISPDSMVATFAGVLSVLTLGVSGIAGISLVVAGILVMNLMLMTVRQRTTEIGLLKALGATDRTVRAVFLTEAAVLAVAGAATGVAVGLLVVFVLTQVYPAVPFRAPVWALAAASAAALGTALLFAWMPAGAAARLEPVLALGRR